ncbi:MAG: SusD/RagB family nutrient-binding outer membrane lipoprotein, partial [Bacteroidales bacterium]|nr:SusD/RagB family nutrient-binding outer membrane lipoprotein [Bacteroidales bacterium]
MKIKYPVLFLIALLAGLNSCDKDFEEININPVAMTTMDPVYEFADAQRNSARTDHTYPGQIVQQIITPYGGVLEGGNRNTFNDSNANGTFNGLFQGPVRALVDVIEKTKDDPVRSNLYNMARIWKAYCFMLLVDTYGDVPYSEAGRGYLDATFLPKYDDQKVIYADILKELEEATDALDATKVKASGELFYKGDIAKWKKLGNSLLLRAGMRYTKYDASVAEAAAAKAVDPSRGGVMSSNDDNAFIQYSDVFTFGLGNTLNGGERHNYYVGAPFVDYLKLTNDPRMLFTVVKYEIPTNPLATAGAANTNPGDQQGMPYGYDETTLLNAPGFPGKIGAAYAYSQFNRATVAKTTEKFFYVTYACTQLLLAEAAHRGYITTGTAEEYYEAGIRGALSQHGNDYGEAYASTVEQQDAFLAGAEIAFDPDRALEQINSQYWV